MIGNLNDFKYNNYCKNLKKYKNFVRVMKNKYISIPGLYSSFIPQGICIVNDYCLITAYDYFKKSNSVVYVIDNIGNFIKTVELDGKYHCGGISYHKSSNSIYITGESGVNNGKSSYINRYNLDDILNKDKVYAVAKFEVDNNNILKSSITNKSSIAYLSICDDELYLGNFTWHNNGKIKRYKLDKFGNLMMDTEVIYNSFYKKIQSICKFKYRDEDYYLFSTSYGRFKDSYLYVSKFDGSKYKTIKKISMPPMMEQFVVSGDEIFILFESGSSVYSNAKSKVEDVIVIDLNKLLN